MPTISNVDTIVDILDGLGGKETIDVFNSIAERDTTSSKLKILKKGLTKKQYYTRTRLLITLGLVKRKKGKFVITPFRMVVHKFLLDIDAAVKNMSKLKALDIIFSSTELQKDNKSELAKKILADSKLEGIFS